MKSLEKAPLKTGKKVLRWMIRLGVWGAMVILIACAWLVNSTLSFAPHAHARVHDTQNWVPWGSTETEVRDFMDACHGTRHQSVASWPVRFLARHSFRPNWKRSIDSMFIFRWTLEPETRRELAFQRTLEFQPKSRNLTLDNYLLIANGWPFEKQRGLARMLERGDISPARHRELNALVEQAFPDKEAYNW